MTLIWLVYKIQNIELCILYDGLPTIYMKSFSFRDLKLNNENNNCSDYMQILLIGFKEQDLKPQEKKIASW